MFLTLKNKYHEYFQIFHPIIHLLINWFIEVYVFLKLINYCTIILFMYIFWRLYFKKQLNILLLIPEILFSWITTSHLFQYHLLPQPKYDICAALFHFKHKSNYVNSMFKTPNNIYHTYDKYFSFGGILNIPSKVFLSIDFFSLISCHILWPLHLVILSSLCSFTLLVHFLRNISFIKPGLYLFHSIFHTVLQKINNHYSFRCKPSIEEKNKI